MFCVCFADCIKKLFHLTSEPFFSTESSFVLNQTSYVCQKYYYDVSESRQNSIQISQQYIQIQRYSPFYFSSRKKNAIILLTQQHYFSCILYMRRRGQKFQLNLTTGHVAIVPQTNDRWSIVRTWTFAKYFLYGIAKSAYNYLNIRPINQNSINKSQLRQRRIIFRVHPKEAYLLINSLALQEQKTETKYYISTLHPHAYIALVLNLPQHLQINVAITSPFFILYISVLVFEMKKTFTYD